MNFATVDSNQLGSTLAPQMARALINSQRQEAFRCDPREREERLERANCLSDLLGLFHIFRAASYGR